MRPFFKAVLLATLLSGTLDILSAYVTQYIYTGKFANRMFQYIAGGGLGLETSMKGGFWVGVLGFFFHFFIAFAFTLLFFIIYPKLKLQVLNKYVVCIGIGFLYAPVVDLIMNFIVLPLSKLPPRGPYELGGAFKGWLIFAPVFTIPIAVCAYLYYKNRALRAGEVAF